MLRVKLARTRILIYCSLSLLFFLGLLIGLAQLFQKADELVPSNAALIKMLDDLGATYELNSDGGVSRISLNSVSSDELDFLFDSSQTGDLTSLTFFASRFEDSYKLPLLPSLRHLRLDDCVVESNMLLENVKRIETLGLLKTTIPEGIFPRGGLKNLKGLVIAGSSISMAHLAELENSSGLERLVLKSLDSFEESEADFLHRLPKLRRLVLVETAFSGEALRQFASSDTIEELALNRTGLQDDGCRHIAGFRNLRLLDLQNISISDQGFAHFSKLQNLKRIYLWNTRITEASIETLEQMKGLDEVYCKNQRIKDWLRENGFKTSL